MAENKLADVSTEFAIQILKLTDSVKGHYSLSNQLERSGTSIGANIREAADGTQNQHYTTSMVPTAGRCGHRPLRWGCGGAYRRIRDAVLRYHTTNGSVEQSRSAYF